MKKLLWLFISTTVVVSCGDNQGTQSAEKNKVK